MFIEKLVQIAYSQELAQAGHVEPTDDLTVLGEVSESIEAFVDMLFDVEEEPKISYPIFQDIIQDEDGDWLVISGTNAIFAAAPIVVRARLLSNKNPFNKADLAHPYQIRVFNVADLRPMQGDRANWIKGGFVEADPYKGMTSEAELGEQIVLPEPQIIVEAGPATQVNTREQFQQLYDNVHGAGIPLSPNLEYHYYWIEGREIRVLRSDKAEIARMAAMGHRR